MTTLVLWPTSKGWPDADLLGRPVWRRTLEATRRLGARRKFWLATEPPPGGAGTLEALSPSELGKLRGVALVVPAELALVAPASLKRLAKNGADGALSLVGAAGPARAGALAVPGAALKREVDGRVPPSFDELVSRLRPAPVFPEDEEELLRVDSSWAWSDAARFLRRRKLEDLIRRGVLVPHPESVLVDPEVHVASGAVLRPWIHLEGATRIGRGCDIGSFSHVVDSTLGPESVLLDHCYVRSSRIGKGASIGPFAHLRPDSDVGHGAKVGNFVELKKTRLGAGAKAPHLSYLGDALVGKDANVGAGTITCNYDGVRKHQTVVGDGAFIGSDVQLVAPVRVGKGAFIAAGSCIVEDVPAHALALARSRQIVKRGWAARRKKQRKQERGG